MRRKAIATAMTRQDLITAFWLHYKEKPIEKITIQSICTTAGYNRSTFYEYFTDIYDLLQQIEAELIEEITGDIKLSEDAVSEELIQVFARIYENYGEKLAVFLGTSGDPAFLIKYKRALKPIIADYYHFETKSMDSYIAFEYVVSGILSALEFWLGNREQFSAVEFAETVQKLIFFGIKDYIKTA